jgi:Bacteriophage HK97-gp10, putative tail-component
MVVGADQLARLPDKIKADIVKVMGQLAQQLPPALQAVTPVDTGHLKQSWKTRHYSYQVKLRNTAFYADFVENGTRRSKAQPMITPMLPVIEAEIERAILSGTDLYLKNGQFPDRATQLKTAYRSKYGDYGSASGFSG